MSLRNAIVSVISEQNRRHLELLLNPKLLMQKGVGKIKRRFVPEVPPPVKRQIGKAIWFDFQYEPYLDLGDFRAMYTNSYDIALITLMKKHLMAGDIFIDVGANIGYITAVAASVVGKQGETHSFEPLKECFVRLQSVANLNPGYKFILNNYALGDQDGELEIAYSLKGDSRNATLVPGIVKESSHQVCIKRMDRYILENVKRPDKIKMIKIDVEGFEFPVLLGLSQFFETTQYRPMIVCEIKPWELPRLKHSSEEFANYMRRWSYQAVDIVNNWRVVDITKLRGLEVVVFQACRGVQ